MGLTKECAFSGEYFWAIRQSLKFATISSSDMPAASRTGSLRFCSGVPILCLDCSHAPTRCKWYTCVRNGTQGARGIMETVKASHVTFVGSWHLLPLDAHMERRFPVSGSILKRIVRCCRYHAH